MKNLFFLLSVMLPLTLLGDSTPQGKTHLFSACMEIRNLGLFNEETMACFPWLRQAVAEKLCETRVRRYTDLSKVGFGTGFEGYGVELRSPAEFLEMNELARRIHMAEFWASINKWREENCDNEPTAASTQDELLEPWREVYERLPQSLVAPWRSCWKYLLATTAPGFQPGGARCFVEVSDDPGGEGETISFTLRVDPVSWFDAKTRLQQSLETQGVDCGKKVWRKGKRLKNTRPNVLKCRRLGRSAVYIRAVTGKGTCEAELPELAEIDWRDQCEGRE